MDVITCAIFRDCQLRGVGVVRGESLPSPIDLTRRPYNMVTVPCDRVIVKTILGFFIRPSIRRLHITTRRPSICSFVRLSFHLSIPCPLLTRKRKTAQHSNLKEMLSCTLGVTGTSSLMKGRISCRHELHLLFVHKCIPMCLTYSTFCTTYDLGGSLYL